MEPQSSTKSRYSETRLRVRYAETDQMGVVYYANYLIWMEIARTEFCLAAGFRYRDLEKEEGIAIVVAEATCRYQAPARYDDEILVRTTLERLRRRTLTFSYQIFNASTSERLADGETMHVSLGTGDGRPRALPPDYYARLDAWEVPSPDPAGARAPARESPNPGRDRSHRAVPPRGN